MLRDLIEAAVQKHVGENVGVLLSGGIDSSTVAHFAPGLPAFTGYYQGDAYDERPWARLMTDGREWHEIEITPDDFIQHFDAYVEAVPPPHEGPGGFGQFMVARYVTRLVGTVLSGEGGDELFGGYARLHIVAGVPVPDGYADYTLPDGYPTDLREALDWEFTVNLQRLLALDEKINKAWGLTAVAPMTDSSVTDYVIGNYQPIQRVGKRILKYEMRGLLPDEIIGRTDKRGFAVPYVEWANGPLRDFFMDRIGYVPDPDKPWARGYWNDLCEAGVGAVR